jgi:hypothetical protein
MARYLLQINTGTNPKLNIYFATRKCTQRDACGSPDGPWAVLKTGGPAEAHDPPTRGSTQCCPGPTLDGATGFWVLNFALEDPGTTAIALMHPWKEHSFLRRRSWCTNFFRGSSIPKTNEDLPP